MGGRGEEGEGRRSGVPQGSNRDLAAGILDLHALRVPGPGSRALLGSPAQQASPTQILESLAEMRIPLAETIPPGPPWAVAGAEHSWGARRSAVPRRPHWLPVEVPRGSGEGPDHDVMMSLW